jgi:hypothetical protein
MRTNDASGSLTIWCRLTRITWNPSAARSTSRRWVALERTRRGVVEQTTLGLGAGQGRVVIRVKEGAQTRGAAVARMAIDEGEESVAAGTVLDVRLGDRLLEVARACVHREVQECAGRSRDGDPVAGCGLVGGEHADAVDDDARLRAGIAGADRDRERVGTGWVREELPEPGG